MKLHTQHLVPSAEGGIRPHVSARKAANATAVDPSGGRFANATVRAEYRGYRLTASSNPAHADLYSANLLVERRGRLPHSFQALDYFYDARQAVSYASAWGRLWVDSNGYTEADGDAHRPNSPDAGDYATKSSRGNAL